MSFEDSCVIIDTTKIILAKELDIEILKKIDIILPDKKSDEIEFSSLHNIPLCNITKYF